MPEFPVIPSYNLLSPEDKAKARDLSAMGLMGCDWDRGGKSIYFIKGYGIPVVKIGQTFSQKIDQRLAKLQTGSPVKLSIILTIDCGYMESQFSIELRIHELFKAYRVHGEWFKMEGELLEFIESSGAKYE